MAKSKNSSRKYIGVYLTKDNQFIAKLNFQGQRFEFGPFKTEEQAARHYDIEVLKRDPNRTALNFPSEDREMMNIAKRLKALRRKFDKNFGRKDLSAKQKNKDKYMREKFPLVMRNKICAKQKWKCNYCQDVLSDKIIIDHMVPLFLGGSNHTYNLQALCPSCDRFKTSYLDHKVLKPMNQEQQITPKDVIKVQKEYYHMMQCIDPNEVEDDNDNNDNNDNNDDNNDDDNDNKKSKSRIQTRSQKQKKKDDDEDYLPEFKDSSENIVGDYIDDLDKSEILEEPEEELFHSLSLPSINKKKRKIIDSDNLEQDSGAKTQPIKKADTNLNKDISIKIGNTLIQITHLN